MLNLVREAIQKNDCNKLKQLLDKDPKAIEGKDKDGVKLAFYAALSGNIEIMRFIVEYSMASFNETDPWGNTVLHYGVQS
ncbi:MAG: ankyrin repeat domain-containing protein [Lachnospiraceae bacterium]